MAKRSPAWRVWLGLATLCLLAGSGLLLDELAPNELPVQAASAGRLALASLLFGICALLLRCPGQPASWPSRVRVAAWGAVLLAALPLTFTAAGTAVSGGTELLLFASVPAALVFLRSQTEARFGSAEDSSMRLFVPALAGLGGAGLLIPWSVPARPSGEFWLAAMAAMAVLTALALIQLKSLLNDVQVLTAAACVCVGAAAANLCGTLLSPSGSRGIHPSTLDHATFLLEILRFLLEALSVILSLWVLRELGPVAYASRYLLVLLVALAESFGVARARLTWTVAAGACLMLGASAVLLQAREGDAPDSAFESHRR